MDQCVKGSAHKEEDLSSISSTRLKKSGIVAASACNTSTGEAETRGFVGSTGQWV